MWQAYGKPLLPILLPAIGYALAFTYEWGFSNTFKIPIEFIELSLTNILIAIATVIIFGSIALLFWFAYIHSSFKGIRAISGDLWFFSLWGLVAIVRMVLYREMWDKWIWFFVWLAGAIVFYWLHSLVLKWLHWTPKNRAKTPEDENKEAESRKSYNARVLKVIGYTLSTIIFVFWVAYASGQASAERQDRFLIPSLHQDSIVLRVYGDNAVCVPIIKQEIKEDHSIIRQFKVNGNISILNLKSITNLEMTLEEVGRVDKQ